MTQEASAPLAHLKAQVGEEGSLAQWLSNVVVPHTVAHVSTNARRGDSQSQ